MDLCPVPLSLKTGKGRLCMPVGTYLLQQNISPVQQKLMKIWHDVAHRCHSQFWSVS